MEYHELNIECWMLLLPCLAARYEKSKVSSGVLHVSALLLSVCRVLACMLALLSLLRALKKSKRSMVEMQFFSVASFYGVAVFRRLLFSATLDTCRTWRGNNPS